MFIFLVEENDSFRQTVCRDVWMKVLPKTIPTVHVRCEYHTWNRWATAMSSWFAC